jgi:hypothetical protein
MGDSVPFRTDMHQLELLRRGYTPLHTQTSRLDNAEARNTRRTPLDLYKRAAPSALSAPPRYLTKKPRHLA